MRGLEALSATMAAGDGLLQAGWDLGHRFPPQMPGFAKARLNDLDSGRQRHQRRTTAV